MSALPLDVWIMMLFSVAVFFGISLWMLVYTLRQEERKMRILKEQDGLDTYPPAALHDLRTWIDTHPDDPDVETAQTRYCACIEALRSSNDHFYAWRDADLDRFDVQ